MEAVRWLPRDLPEVLARALPRRPRRGVGPSSEHLASPPAGDLERLSLWLDGLAKTKGVAVARCDLTPSDLEHDLLRCAPALIRLGSDASPSFVAIVGRRRRNRVSLLSRHGVCSVPVAQVAAWLRAQDVGVASPHGPRLRAFLSSFGLRRTAVDAALSRLPDDGSTVVDRCWTLEVEPGRGWWDGLARRIPTALLGLIGLVGLERGLWLAAWAILGQTVLSGRAEPGWALAWVLAIASTIPVRVALTWLLGHLSVTLGVDLRRHLLGAIGRLETGALLGGPGRVFARAQECQDAEARVLSSGIEGIVNAVDVAVVIGVFVGVAALVHTVAFVAFLVLVGVVHLHFARACRDWSDRRLNLTNVLIENVLHARTRLVQQSPEGRHVVEDELHEGCQISAKTMDSRHALAVAALPRLWLVAAILGLLPSILGEGTDRTELAIVLGGVLFGRVVIERLANTGLDLGEALIAFRRVWTMLRGPKLLDVDGLPSLASRLPIGEQRLVLADRPIVEARDLVWGAREGGAALLRGVDLSIQAGERILVQGASGSGKSTLVELLGAARRGRTGSLLLHSLDLDTVGTRAWRSAVVCVPQLDRNHMFAESLAFNLLLGRRWPPRPEDLVQAETICVELGLGDLLDAMPEGLGQRVGEAGWRLSHGERARIYVARALLQSADVVVLDESLSSLDPPTQLRVIEVIDRRARTLMLVVHA